MTNGCHSKTFCVQNVCVQVCLCAVVDGGWAQCKRWHPIERLIVCLHIVLLICMSIHARCHLSPSSPLFFWSFPESSSMPGKQTQPGIDFWLNVHFFLPCPVTSTNLTNTNLISNNRHRGAACQVRCAVKRLHSTLDLCARFHLRVSPHPHRLCLFFLSIARSICMLCFLFHVDYITT